MLRRFSNLADVAAQFLSTLVGRGCYLVLQIFLARIIGPREFGLYAIGWTVTGLIGTLAPLGMPQVVLRYGLAGRQALHSIPMLVATLSGLTCVILLASTAGPVARDLFGDPDAAAVISALAPSVLLLGVFGVWTSALRSSHHNIASAALGALMFALYLVATIVIFSIGLGRTPAAAGHAYTFAILATLLPTAWLLHRLPGGSPPPRLPVLMQFGVVTMLIHSANLLNLWADRVVVGIMLDARAVGIYQVASQLAVVAIVLRGAVTTVFESRVPKLAHHGATPPDITREFLAATRTLLHISTPGLICLTLTADYWATTLFGPNYDAAAIPLAVLIVGQLALTFTGPSVTALQMTGDERIAMHLTTATCILNVVGNVALIPFFGLAGSAAASGLANIAVGGLCLWRLRRTGRLRVFFAKISDIIVATLVCFATLGIVFYYLGSSSILMMLCLVAGGYILYGIIVLLRCRVEDEVLDLVRTALFHILRLEPPARMPAP